MLRFLHTHRKTEEEKEPCRGSTELGAVRNRGAVVDGARMQLSKILGLMRQKKSICMPFTAGGGGGTGRMGLIDWLDGE